MKTIWKYELTANPTTVLEVPFGGQVLCVQNQYELPCIWVLVDPDLPKEQRTFVLYPTGGSMPDSPGAYLGTVQLLHGGLVLHVFEETKP